MSATTFQPTDVQVYRKIPGGFSATCGNKTATSFRSALYAARAAAAAYFDVSESRIEIAVEGPFITASLKPATGGAA